MMYSYITLADGTEITHSQIVRKGEDCEVVVHFERPTDHGFDSARCVLPSYNWLVREGFTSDEIADFEQFLQYNAHLLFRYAESGGLQIA